MTSIELLGFGGGKPATKGPVADPRVEETAPEDPTAANRRRRTTTIVLNSDSPANGKAPEAVPNRPSDGTVQQAHFETETDVKPLTAADVRIAQLEQMVSELRAMHADQAAPAVDPAADPSTPPRRLEEPDDDRSRFKVRAAQGAPVEPKPEAEKQQVRNASATAAGSLPPKSHPLSDLDDAPARSLRTAAQTSTEHRRHPLEDLDDESPFDAPRERRTIPATQGPKQVDQDRGSSFDPFDPIEIDAIETTAVEETPAIRRKLRAAKQ